MNILVTGATSKIGQYLLPELFKNNSLKKIYILTRNKSNFSQLQIFADPRIEILIGDLNEAALNLPTGIDICLHMAGLTHSIDQNKYFITNFKGTEKLAAILFRASCKKFIYISSQTAGIDSGAYGQSKFESEQALLKIPWKELVIIRPAEVFGMNSNEGIDKFDKLASEKKIYPWLFSINKVNFSPFSVYKLIHFLMSCLNEKQEGKHIYILRGPLVSSCEFAKYYWQKYRAIPIPVCVPVLNILNKFLYLIGRPLFPQDQIPRLFGVRGQKSDPQIQIKEIIFESPFTK